MLNFPRIVSALRGIPARGEDDFMARLRVSFVLLAVYWLAIFLATHIPVRSGPPSRLPVDKMAHLVIYCGLTALMAWTWYGRRWPGWKPMLAIVAIAAVYGMVDEWTQGLVPSRTPDFRDWLSDLLGAAVGVVGYGGFCLVAQRWVRRARVSDSRH